MKLAPALAAAALLTIGSLVALVAWGQAPATDHERELRWLDGYATWAAEIDAVLEQRSDAEAAGCERLRALAGPSYRAGCSGNGIAARRLPLAAAVDRGRR